MNLKLSASERILSSLIYFALIILIGYYLNGNYQFLYSTSNDYYVLFVSSALMLIMGDYITEPYYTKPVDVIAKTIAILLVLGSFSIEQQSKFIFFELFFYFNVLFLLSALVLTLFGMFGGFDKIKKSILFIITKLASPAIIFSILYLLTLFSFFDNHTNDFLILFGLWMLLVFRMPIEKIAILIIKLFSYVKNDKLNTSIGMAIGCDNPFLYQIEVYNEIHQENDIKKGQLVYLELEKDIAIVGIIFNEKHLLNKKWLSIYMLEDANNEPLKINTSTKKLIENTKTIYSKNNQIYVLDINSINADSKSKIESNYMYKNKNNFIGFVSENSNINKISFQLLIDTDNTKHIQIGEGTILTSKIFTSETLFQIMDGLTVEEKLENHDNYGYTTAIAKKIGNYTIQNNELNTVKWLPHIYSPVFLLEDSMDTYEYKKFIGKLPNTNYGIQIKDYDSLVTHNTAILGILGIGKSRLTFELLKKVHENTDAKIICIDITTQYLSELTEYGFTDTFNYSNEEVAQNSFKEHYSNINKDKELGGTNTLFIKYMTKVLKEFMESDSSIFIINPNIYTIGKQVGDIKKKKLPDETWIEEASMRDLTIAEITRVISQVSIEYCQAIGITEKARLLLVYEEAHSLIPEWNSVANEGDKNASNGTAKVILQGRKYGLGSFIVTQRTANISKSILNQCNTIFAMRVFDDTGKQFLENYIGRDYANTLPTLEERHAIVTGKAMKLKQPIIISLNDMDNIIVKD